MKRKLLAIICIIALCVSTMTPVFATDAAADSENLATGSEVAATGEEAVVETLELTDRNPLYEDSTDADGELSTGITSDKVLSDTSDTSPVFCEKNEVVEQIRNAMVNRQTSFTVYYTNYEAIDEAAWKALLYGEIFAQTDNPKEGDYLSSHYSELLLNVSTNIYSSGKREHTLKLTVEYHSTAAQETKVDSKVAEILDDLGIDNISSDYLKAKKIYKYICDNVSYDYDYARRSAYDALFNKEAVCQGYSSLLHRMLLEAGVDARIIRGKGLNEAHSWNIIKIGSKYYNADSTWDTGKTSYEWFMKGSNSFADHTRDAEYNTTAFNDTYPTSTSNYVLSKPTGLSLKNIASTGKPKLTWKAVPGAEKYEVWRKIGANGTYKKLCTTSGTTLLNTSAEVGKTYYYKVRAIDSNNSYANSSYSVVYYITCDLSSPTLTVSNVASSGKIQLTWTKVDGAAKYQVYRSKDGGNTYSLLYTTTGTALTNTSTEAGKIYYYKVKAVHPSNSAADSAYSAVKSRACDLARPTITLATIPSSGKPRLTWEKVEGADKYEVWRKVGSNGTYERILTTTGTACTNTSTTPGEIYYYKVKAICASNSGGNSAFSTVKYIACDLAQPKTTITTVASSGYPKLTWDAVEGADKYEIYRATSKTGTYTKMYTTTGTTYTNSYDVKPGTIYYYKVRAICEKNSGGNSAYSEVKGIACDLARPTITLITVTSSGYPKLQWGAVSGATKYEIYRATSATGTYTKMYTTTGTAYTNTYNVVAGTTYYYKIKAICGTNSGGNSAYSAVKSIKAQ